MYATFMFIAVLIIIYLAYKSIEFNNSLLRQYDSVKEVSENRIGVGEVEDDSEYKLWMGLSFTDFVGREVVIVGFDNTYKMLLVEYWVSGIEGKNIISVPSMYDYLKASGYKYDLDQENWVRSDE